MVTALCVRVWSTSNDGSISLCKLHSQFTLTPPCTRHSWEVLLFLKFNHVMARLQQQQQLMMGDSGSYLLSDKPDVARRTEMVGRRHVTSLEIAIFINDNA